MATQRKVWIEAALNGPWGRERQRGIPLTVDEIIADGIAATQAGAAIVHLHAYDAESGRQRDDPSIYARIIEGIRARADAIVYPTIPLAGSDYASGAGRRYGHVDALAGRGLLEWMVIDPGSVAFVRFEEVPGSSPGFIYENPLPDIRDGLALAKQHGLHPSYAIYEPGFTRLGAALAAATQTPVPIYRLMFSDEFAWGFPPQPAFLDAHLQLLAEAAPVAPWMVAGLGVDIRPLIPAAVERGGHVRVGLEDAPWGSELGNVRWVEEAVRSVRLAGGEPATAAEV
ncbi:MAG: 3-keto-5-aminohexanoate cleavage protein, partial [Acetobacteraceae bacterium]|nr:3-keto-5-aminohexanoate cleavage protein [Acetobacteraceae bacterium]